MPLPVGRNIEIRNSVRKGLGREPVIEFVDEAALRTVSPSKLRLLIDQGAVSAGKAENIIVEREALERPKIAKPTRAGDYVTGLSAALTMRLRFDSAGVVQYANSQLLSGPFIVSDMYLTSYSGSGGTVTANDLGGVSIGYGSLAARNAADFSVLTMLVNRRYRSDDSFGAAYDFIVPLGGEPHTFSLHPDTYIDASQVVFTVQNKLIVGSTSGYEVELVIVVREVGAVERVEMRPRVSTPRERVERPASVSNRTTEARISGAPVKTVQKSKNNEYMVFLTDREFVVPADQLKTIYKHFVPLAVVPVDEADDARVRIQSARLRRGIIRSF